MTLFGLVTRSSNFGGDFEKQPTVPRSSPGVALGTGGYMSPEQVSGGTLDGRLGIISLGARCSTSCCRALERNPVRSATGVFGNSSRIPSILLRPE